MIQSSDSSIDKLNKLNWCRLQSKGIKLIEPNKVLAIKYLNSAKETLNLIEFDEQTNSNLWLATHKYYFLYFCAYSLLINLGIKSEIHDCTIALIKELESKKIFNLKLGTQLESSKNQRIYNQYYLKNEKVDINKEELNLILLNVLKILNETNENTRRKAKNIFIKEK